MTVVVFLALNKNFTPKPSRCLRCLLIKHPSCVYGTRLAEILKRSTEGDECSLAALMMQPCLSSVLFFLLSARMCELQGKSEARISCRRNGKKTAGQTVSLMARGVTHWKGSWPESSQPSIAQHCVFYFRQLERTSPWMTADH